MKKEPKNLWELASGFEKYVLVVASIQAILGTILFMWGFFQGFFGAY